MLVYINITNYPFEKKLLLWSYFTDEETKKQEGEISFLNTSLKSRARIQNSIFWLQNQVFSSSMYSLWQQEISQPATSKQNKNKNWERIFFKRWMYSLYKLEKKELYPKSPHTDQDVDSSISDIKFGSYLPIFSRKSWAKKWTTLVGTIKNLNVTD
jgi:hypothetical protein